MNRSTIGSLGESAQAAPNGPATSNPQKRFSVLLATNHLFGWTGSETLLLTLAEGLLDWGCNVVVYVRHLDQSWAGRYLDPRALLTDSIDAIRQLDFDLAHVQHNACLVDVRAALPSLPMLFSSLGVLPFLEQPPPFDVGVSDYLAISEEVASNLVNHGIPESQIHVVRNLVSERRFSPSTPIRPRPERILVLSYKMDEPRRALLRETAHRLGSSIRFVGESGVVLTQEHLATAINQSDVVVSLGRGVVEAMLCSRVPLVFDIHGGDGLVTPDNLDVLKKHNFSGRCYRKEYGAEELISELNGYRQSFGDSLRELAREQFSMERNLPRILDIYTSITNAPTSPLQPTLGFFAALAREDLRQCKRHQEFALALEREVRRVKRTVSWQVTKPLRLLANSPRIVAEWFSPPRTDFRDR